MSNIIFIKKAVITCSAKGTMALGKKIAQKIIKQGPRQGAFVLALRGDLGSGKTTFIQGLAKGLDIEDRITSPTFVLMKKFSIFNFQFSNKIKTKNLKFKSFYHFDCYRIDKPEEILELGWREIIANPQNIVAVEWPEKIKKFLPKETKHLNFKFIDKNQREIKIGKTAVFVVK